MWNSSIELYLIWYYVPVAFWKYISYFIYWFSDVVTSSWKRKRFFKSLILTFEACIKVMWFTIVWRRVAVKSDFRQHVYSFINVKLFYGAVHGQHPDCLHAFILKVRLQDVWFYCGGADRWKADWGMQQIQSQSELHINQSLYWGHNMKNTSYSPSVYKYIYTYIHIYLYLLAGPVGR